MEQNNRRTHGKLAIRKPEDKLKYLLGRIDNNSLSVRIRSICKKLPECIYGSVFNHAKANLKYMQAGNKFVDMRNDIAHGNELRRNFSDI